MAKECRVCMRHESLREVNPEKWAEFYQAHIQNDECEMDTFLSSGSMERLMAEKLFNR